MDSLPEGAHFPLYLLLTSTRIVVVQEGTRWVEGDPVAGQPPGLTPRPPLVFQDIDTFGNEITQLARPLPVEYLIIDVSVPSPSPRGQDSRRGGLARARALERLPPCLAQDGPQRCMHHRAAGGSERLQILGLFLSACLLFP